VSGEGGEKPEPKFEKPAAQIGGTLFAARAQKADRGDFESGV
jgi:hypothetical protein